uniref:DUF3615 domain-containing protein n=1 Tax=Triticum urartu TaxID=4572 RepID=A0A8R7PB43_TRIUA
MLRMASKYLKDGGKLSHVDADHLAEGLFYSISECSEQTEHPETSIKVMNKLTYTRMEQQVNKFWDQHARVVGTVRSMIDVYNRRQLGVPKYELHVICGVNAHVDGPVYTAPFTGTYRYSHINFLATPSADAPPTLFFAEYSNDDGSSQDMGWCCPVAVPSPGTEQVRCLYCEYDGSRIVHPVQGGFHGRGRDFEKMWGGEELYSEWHTNDSIIKRGREAAYWVDYLEDDCIYNTYRLDDKRIGPKVVI